MAHLIEKEQTHVLVETDWHIAHRTGARTIWFVWKDGGWERLDDTYKAVESTREGGKTHWIERYELPVGTLLLRKRISNRGNIHRRIYIVTVDGLKKLTDNSFA